MTIGEIKSEALRLSFPDPQLYVDGQDSEAVSAAISSLKEDHNYADFLAASVGSINRALSVMEQRGISPLMSRVVTVNSDSEAHIPLIDLRAYESEMLFVEGVYKIKDGIPASVSFENMGGGRLAVADAEKNQRFIIKYKTKINRIGSLTPEEWELPLSDSLAAAIPYFIKADLLSSDDPDASSYAMARFDDICVAHPVQYAEHGSVISLYRQEEIM